MKYYISIKLSLFFICFLSACGQDINQDNIVNHVSINTNDVASLSRPLSCPEVPKEPERALLDVDNATGSPYEDLDREIKDLGTSIIVNKFFQSEDTLFNFMKLTYGTINTALDEYKKDHDLEDKAISLVFKGGNILRIIANQFFTYLSYDARTMLKDYYDNFFKRSDIDFSIIIDEGKLKNNYIETLNDITTIAYQSLNKIRAEINKNKEEYFNLFQLKSKLVERDLEEYLSKLNLMESIKDIENIKWNNTKFLQLQLLDDKANNNMICHYEGKYDYRFDFTKDNKKILVKSVGKQPHWIMNSINTTLKWPFDNDITKLIHFYLVRSKVQFEVVYNKDNKLARSPIGGELIDVGIGVKDDDNLKEIIKNYDAWINDYTLKLGNSDNIINIKGESIEGLAADIHGILFVQNDRPWEANKYEKRLSRLFFLSIVEMLGQNSYDNNHLITYINSIKNNVLDKIKISAMIDMNAIDKLMSDYHKLFINNDLWYSIINVVNNVVQDNDDDKENLIKMINIVEENINNIIKFLNTKPQHIDYKNLYNAKMSSFL